VRVFVPDEKGSVLSSKTAADSLDPSDAALVRNSQNGSLEAFGQLVARYEPRICHFLFRLVGQVEDAEDLTQVAFIKAWRSLRAFEETGNFSAWLYTIARRTALNHFRVKPPVDPHPQSDGETLMAVDSSDPASVLAQKEETAALWRLARGLKPKQYEALWLRYGEGFSIAESAQILGISQLRTRVLIHRARGNLARILELRGDRMGLSHRGPGIASTADGVDGSKKLSSDVRDNATQS